MTAVKPHLEKFQHLDPQQVETYARCTWLAAATKTGR
jgi:hypothetical protein